MYDDISTFKKKANLANFNFRAIAHNNDNDAPEASVHSATVNPFADAAGGERAAADGPLPAEAPPMAEINAAPVYAQRETPVAARRPRAAVTALDDIFSNDHNTARLPDGGYAPGQEENDGAAHHAVPLFALFKSIAAKA
ncbi:hypothetical protein [Acerihabitans arboris]|uniref:Uncharacterized protein n=1 Tax=Acerihabitans arboris TaxID=2691583 RepID=A0A845SFH6_9GAMM|nr:hypothetical protein [Acerihabitans arboris]NDL61694.1 hypothetical protein [Acerihabitans arboris]